MTPERSSISLPLDENQLGSAYENLHSEIDLYEVAEFIYMARVDQLQEMGELRRASDVSNEEELDDHFDDLSRLYRQICGELGLDWPPPPVDVPDER